MKCYLYVITNFINGKQYYGWTINYKQRWKNHKNRYGSKLVYRAIKKYSIENFEFKIICIASEQECKRLEIGMIKVKCSRAPNGYNLTKGGDGATGRNPSIETRRKLSVAHTIKKAREETKKKLFIDNTGKRFGEKTRKKLTIAQIGNQISAKPVLVDNIEYESINEAAISIGCTHSSLYNKFWCYQENDNFPDGWGV